MKNLKNSKYTCEQIPEVDKSEQYTYEENDDLCYELMQLQQSEQAEDGFISHRHYLGSDGRVFTPTLMANHSGQRIPQNETQLVELRRQILLSQNSTSNQLALQHTQLTDELIKNFEKRQQREIDSKGDTQQYYAGGNSGPKLNMNTKSSHKSPKNSDYIRGSILLFSGKSKKQASGQKKGPNEECPSFFDEFEFEEDPPVQPKKACQQNLYQQFL